MWHISIIGSLFLLLLPFVTLDQGLAQEPSEPMYLGWIRDRQSYFMFLPDDDHFEYRADSMTAWNVLVEDNPSGPFANNDWLLGFKVRNGNPIRNHLPTPNNGDYEMGVLTSTQMENRGYDSWEDLEANGVTYRWTRTRDGLQGLVVECDVFVNPAIADDPEQHRKTLTHEFGHALALSHDTFHFNLMYPGTFRQPPNYSSIWYTRMFDLHRERFLLQEINRVLRTNVWTLEQWADMAVWSQTHANSGRHGTLLMTEVTPTRVRAGDQIRLNHIQVENRGNQPALDVRLKIYLSTNATISTQDREIGSFRWETFAGPSSWNNGSLSVRVPTQVAPGEYHVGIILSTPTSERSEANNTAILLNDRDSNFSPQQLTVTAR